MHDLANSANEHHAAVNFLLHQYDKGATAQKNADRYHMLKIANRLAAGGYGSNHGKRSVVRFGIRVSRGSFFQPWRLRICHHVSGPTMWRRSATVRPCALGSRVYRVVGRRVCSEPSAADTMAKPIHWGCCFGKTSSMGLSTIGWLTRTT